MNNYVTKAQQEMQMIQLQQQQQQEEMMLWNEFLQTEEGIEFRNKFIVFVENRRNPAKQTNARIEQLESQLQQLIGVLSQQNAQTQVIQEVKTKKSKGGMTSDV